MAESMPRVPVYPWPEKRALALQEWTKHQLVVVSIATTPADTSREKMRQQVRVALADLLCAALGCQPGTINLVHEPGKPPGEKLSIFLPDHLAKSQIGMSISHEQGLSIAAICLDAAIGVDLVQIDAQIEWQAVAQLYLGAPAAAGIGKLPLSQQASHFALQWASLEAKLKCHHLALTEWSGALDATLADCKLRELDLPQGYAGALAVLV